MAKDKTTTIVQAGAKGGVSAVMPYVAIGVVGYFGLKHLKEMDVDVGGAAGQIIESFTEGADQVIERVKETAGDTYVYITETIEETKEEITEVADVRVEKHGKTVFGGEPKTFSEFLTETRKGEGVLPFYTGFLATIGHYGTGGLLTEPFIEAGRKTRDILPKSIVEKMDVRVYGAPSKSQKVVSGYQSYVEAGGVRAPLATKTPTVGPVAWTPPTKEEMAKKPTKEWKVVK